MNRRKKEEWRKLSKKEGCGKGEGGRVWGEDDEEGLLWKKGVWGETRKMSVRMRKNKGGWGRKEIVLKNEDVKEVEEEEGRGFGRMKVAVKVEDGK